MRLAAAAQAGKLALNDIQARAPSDRRTWGGPGVCREGGTITLSNIGVIGTKERGFGAGPTGRSWDSRTQGRSSSTARP